MIDFVDFAFDSVSYRVFLGDICPGIILEAFMGERSRVLDANHFDADFGVAGADRRCADHR